MAYVITHLCVDCVDKGCVEVCPVECIYELVGPPSPERPNMLYIHPTECISCGACEPECPWQAIYEDRELPPSLAADVALNNQTEEQPSAFRVAHTDRDADGRLVRKPRPTADQVKAHRSRFGL